MRKILLLPILCFVGCQQCGCPKTPIVAQSDAKYRNNKPYFEVVCGVGVSVFWVNWVVSNGIGINFAKDLDIEASRPTFTLAVEYFTIRAWPNAFHFTYG